MSRLSEGGSREVQAKYFVDHADGDERIAKDTSAEPNLSIFRGIVSVDVVCL